MNRSYKPPEKMGFCGLTSAEAQSLEVLEDKADAHCRSGDNIEKLI